MRILRFVLPIFAVTSLFALGAHASDWALDDAHSNIGFSIRHMMVSDVHGSFTKYTGNVTLDDKDVAKSVVAVDIDTASIDTHSEKRDGHLKSPDFFDAAKFPKITFKSTKIEKNGDKKLKVTGDLTMHGVTKPVTLDADVTDEWQDPKEFGGNTHKGVHAVGKINRKDFGLNWQKALDKGGVVAGEDVNLIIDAELVKKTK